MVIAGNHDLTFDLEWYADEYKRRGWHHYKPESTKRVRELLLSVPGLVYLQDEAVHLLGKCTIMDS